MRYLIILILSGSFVTGFTQNQKIDSLYLVLPQAKEDQRIKVLIDLCWEYRFTNADSARYYGMQALVLARESKNLPYEVEALHNIGITLEAQGNYITALEYELKALDIRKTIGDDVKTANTLNNIGIIYDEKGDFIKSLDYYFKARKIYEHLNDREKIAMVISNIGIVLKEQKEYKKVIISYHEALSLYRSLKNEFGIAACHANLGSVYYEMHVYDSSLYYSLAGTQEFEAQNIQQFLAATVCNAGLAYYELGVKFKAKEFLLRAQELNEKYDNKKELASVLIHLANIYKEEEHLGLGLLTAQRGLKIADQIQAKKEVMEARLAIAGLLAANNDFKGAYFQQRQFDVAKDSLYQSEKSKQIEELQTRYETEKKEDEIQLLRQENEIKDFGLKQNRLFILGLIMMVLVLVLVGYLWRNRTTLKQKAELEATRASLRENQLEAVIGSQESERKRFAADLHDGLGQLISAVRLGLSSENADKKTIARSLGLLGDMNEEIRNIAFNLMPQVLMNDGLGEALKEFAARITNTNTIHVSVNVFDLPARMSAEPKIALYRISQEWVNNAIKYSACKHISVQLVQHQDELVITIEDDGNGFDPSTLVNTQGNGWRNISSRLTLIKGVIDVDSQPGRNGTTVTVSVPTYVLIR